MGCGRRCDWSSDVCSSDLPAAVKVDDADEVLPVPKSASDT
jgi:hypothetical protein